MSISTAPEPTAADLDRIIHELKSTWTAALTIRRQSRDDVGYREIYVSLDGQSIGILSYGQIITRQIPPGRHVLEAHNTLFRKKLEFTLTVGEHAGFATANRPGWGTYSALALIIGFLGAGPVYLTLEPEGICAEERAQAFEQ